MDEFQSEHQPHVDEASSTSAANEATAKASAAERHNQWLIDRLQLINDFRADVRDGSTPIAAAVIRHCVADLLETEAHVFEAMRAAVAEDPMTIENSDKYSSPINEVIRLSKGITQVSNLEMHWQRKHDAKQP